MIKKALICGRGESLEFIEHQALQQEYDYVILMNEFNFFSRTDKRIFDFLKKHKIIQFLNVTESGLDSEFINNLNIDSVYVTRLVPNGSRNWWREHRHHRIPESFGLVCNHPSDKLEGYMHITENTVDVVTLFAILDLKISDITVVGVDFYEYGYFLDCSEKDYLEWDNEEHQSVINRIKTSQGKIISLFPDVNFTYVTRSTFDPDLKNCKVVRV